MSSSKTEPQHKPPIAGPEWLAAQRLPPHALICGSAPCLLEDFAAAAAKLPDATVLVVNEAGSVIEGNHLITLHPEKASWFRQRSLNPAITIHTGKQRERASQPDIDVYWPGCGSLATSGGSAIVVALRMGFLKIVLCGMPMRGGDGYFEGSALLRDEPRFGLESPHSDYIKSYRERLVEFARKEPAANDRVRSCSGFTRELFGPPDWQ